MRIAIFNRQKAIALNRKEIRETVTLLLKQEKVRCDEIHLYFVTKKEIATLHHQFFDDPTPTDCISFPIDPPRQKAVGSCLLGEIFICSEVAHDYAQHHNKNPKEEMTLYLIHGLLHLLGYDDQTAVKRRIMRKKEKRCINIVKKI